MSPKNTAPGQDTRRAIGAAIFAMSWLVGSELTSILSLPIHATTQSIVTSLIGAGLGAFVARRDFLAPAFSVWLACWGLALYMLYLVAAPTGQASIAAIVLPNLASIGLSAAATLIGVLSGQLFALHARMKPCPGSG